MFENKIKKLTRIEEKYNSTLFSLKVKRMKNIFR